MVLVLSGNLEGVAIVEHGQVVVMRIEMRTGGTSNPAKDETANDGDAESVANAGQLVLPLISIWAVWEQLLQSS